MGGAESKFDRRNCGRYDKPGKIKKRWNERENVPEKVRRRPGRLEKFWAKADR